MVPSQSEAFVSLSDLLICGVSFQSEEFVVVPGHNNNCNLNDLIGASTDYLILTIEQELIPYGMSSRFNLLIIVLMHILY